VPSQNNSYFTRDIARLHGDQSVNKTLVVALQIVAKYRAKPSVETLRKDFGMCRATAYRWRAAWQYVFDSKREADAAIDQARGKGVAARMSQERNCTNCSRMRTVDGGAWRKTANGRKRWVCGTCLVYVAAKPTTPPKKVKPCKAIS
jgi:uncharacterized protein (DUF433 family)